MSEAGSTDTSLSRRWPLSSTRAFTCRHGTAVARFSAAGIVTPGPALIQVVARVLSGDLDGGDAALTDAASLGEETGASEIVAQALGEQALVAIAHGEWDRAEVLAGQALTVVPKPGSRKAMSRLLSTRCKPARSFTGEKSHPPARRWSARSEGGRC
jgi:hypothetical protein